MSSIRADIKALSLQKLETWLTQGPSPFYKPLVKFCYMQLFYVNGTLGNKENRSIFHVANVATESRIGNKSERQPGEI